MAQTEQEFFTTAVQLSGSLNASSFARKVGVDRSSFSQWKRGKSYPSDSTMLRIANLCDLDPVETLALLNLWRCDEEAKSVYERLLHVAQSTALKCFPYMIALLLASQANMGKILDNNNLGTTPNVEISHKTSLSIHYAVFRAILEHLRHHAHAARGFISHGFNRPRARFARC